MHRHALCVPCAKWHWNQRNKYDVFIQFKRIQASKFSYNSKTQMMWKLVLICLLLVYLFTLWWRNKHVWVTSQVDGRKYLIRQSGKTGDYLQQSADTLAQINKRVENLIQHLNTKYKNDSGKQYFLSKLTSIYSPGILSEAAFDTRYTTYTVDKEEMHVCLHTRDQYEKLYDVNTLMYVILHELAHLCNYDRNGYPIMGHGEEFRQIFKLLVAESMDIGVYKYENYTQKPEEYCGIMITTNIAN